MSELRYGWQVLRWILALRDTHPRPVSLEWIEANEHRRNR